MDPTNERAIQVIINIGLLIFLIPTSFYILIYLGLLFDKMTEPQIKNMNWEEARILGLFALVFVIPDIFIVRKFLKSKKE